MKQLPFGIQTFKDIINQNRLYVDKMIKIKKIKTSFLATLFLITSFSCGETKNQINSASFSFKELIKEESINIGKHSNFKAKDGVNLAYYTSKPISEKSKSTLIFLHGGGAHSLAGYQHLANNLSKNDNITVYLLDLRGHGKSKGKRGDSPKVETIWQDLDAFIDFIKNKHSNENFFLGGHSSGSGLILNYLDWKKNKDIDGYIFIAPEFGYKSNTKNDKFKSDFAKVHTWVFVLSAMTGGLLFGNTTAVEFNYPDQVKKSDPLLISSITRNLSLAITPDKPMEQFSKLKKPFGLFIGSGDELLSPKKVIDYSSLVPKNLQEKSIYRVVEKENHLSILLKADKLIKESIDKISNGE